MTTGITAPARRRAKPARLTAALLLTLPERTESTGKALIGGPFTLTDGTGRRVTEKDFAGRPMLVFYAAAAFMLMTSVMALAQEWRLRRGRALTTAPAE